MSASPYIYDVEALADTLFYLLQFVIESIIAEKGELVPVTTIPLSIDVASQPHDPCVDNVNNPGCAYVLALHSISSQLVTYQPYSVAGVQFDPPKYVESCMTQQFFTI